MKTNQETDFKPTPQYDLLCYLSDEIEPRIMRLSDKERINIMPSYRQFKMEVKEIYSQSGGTH